ncbi:MAG: hypothetical protein AAB481_00880 [Patescibacteria group bacterium]
MSPYPGEEVLADPEVIIPILETRRFLDATRGALDSWNLQIGVSPSKEEKRERSRFRRQVESETAKVNNLLQAAWRVPDELSEQTQSPVALALEPVLPEILFDRVINRLPHVMRRIIPPVAIAASALFSGGGIGSVHAQEPTPPPEDNTGIRLYCSDTSCIITERASPGDYPVNTGDVANTAVNYGLIDPVQAGTCADAFENVNALYLEPDPAGGRPRFRYPGMRFDLPPECLENKSPDAIPPTAADVPTELPHDNPNPQPPYNPLNLLDCLGTLGILLGLGGASHVLINRRHHNNR